MTSERDKIVLDISNAAKTFGSGTEALKAINLEIRKSSFVALLGPSGCGKSTLLRMISGLVTPSTGTLTKHLDDDKSSDQIGFVFQDPTLMPWANVSENVALPLRISGQDSTEIKERVENVLSWIDMTDFSQSYPRELSGGMRMRVSIARALVTEPSLLLLDEPFAALDEFTRSKLNEDLLAIWRAQEWTSIFVTHSIREAVFLAERVIVMSSRPGRIVADVEVPFGYPRSPDLQNNHAFADLCAAVSNYLATGMEESAK